MQSLGFRLESAGASGENSFMLERVVHGNGVVTYQSPRLKVAGVAHGFSTRVGGVSTAPFDTLNLGKPTGCSQQDDNVHLTENYLRLQQAIGAGVALRCWVQQVHGNVVGLIEPEGEGEYAQPMDAEIRDRWQGQTDADALLTDQANLLLTIRVADCFPVLLASADGQMVAAAHAGWRGVVNGVVPAVLQAMGERGIEPESVVAAIGPGISAEHFEVGDEVAQEFVRTGLGEMVKSTTGGKPHIDLQAALISQLVDAGVMAIDQNTVCTVRDAKDFYSHRRDQGITGRLAAVIMKRSS